MDRRFQRRSLRRDRHGISAHLVARAFGRDPDSARDGDGVAGHSRVSTGIRPDRAEALDALNLPAAER
jgi:hypothetical protein